MSLAHQVAFWFEMADSAYTLGFMDDYDRAMTMAWKKEDELCKAVVEDECAFNSSYDLNEEEALSLAHGRQTFKQIMDEREYWSQWYVTQAFEKAVQRINELDGLSLAEREELRTQINMDTDDIPF